jgi:hypothetical protein
MALNILPLSGQSLNVTRDPIRDNFSFINTGVMQDHQELNSGANSGMHNKVSSLVQPSADIIGYIKPANSFITWNAIPNTAASAFYPIILATSEMNILRQGDAKAIPFTAALKNPTGWTYLPSGILLKWGTATVKRNSRSATAPTNIVAFPLGAGIPVFSAAPYFVTAIQTFSAATSNGDINTAPCVGEITATDFKVFPRANGAPGSGNIDILYLAIGIGPV